MRARIFYLLLCGLVLGGIIHIAVVLLIPTVGDRDAARQIMQSNRGAGFFSLSGSNNSKVQFQDPFFEMAACRFELAEAGVIVSGDPFPDFWSAVVYDERGRVVYSMNKRTAIGDRLQMLIVNPIQMAALRQLQPAEIETSIVVETPIDAGFILLRALSRDKSLRADSQAYLSNAKCEAYFAN